ncbi:SCO7613 C-terminal domain-containing membrane protein [Agromyces sp. NPDC057865]|uniref:SCO7613 C-terminal domain-containing membrane protein n=1 Tax=Agromyces sp. NPDC057865 TaxID=3346267 RepID=UPI00367348A6
MTTPWTALAVRYLQETALCPRCDAELLGAATCPQCHAVLGGAAGAEVWAASRRAADAILERDRLATALPTLSPRTDAVPTAVASTPVVADETTSTTPPTDERSTIAAVTATAEAPASQVSVQSVLAVAGAGLIAVAAIVFALLNPDVGFGVRTAVIATVTVVFVAGSWLLRRRGVTFSAEAIGALALVFLALDAQAASELVPFGDPWVFAALGTLAGSAVLLGLAWLARIRVWLWASVVGLALVPAFLGYSVGGDGAVMGHVGVVAVTLFAHELLDRVSTRFASALRPEHLTLSSLQVVVTLVATVQLAFVGSTDVVGTMFRVSVLLALASGAVLGAQHGATRAWGFAAGALAAGALAVLPLAFTAVDPVWLAALIPAGAAATVAVSGLLGNGPRGWLGPRPVQLGALAVLLVLLLPAVYVGFVASLQPLDQVLRAFALGRDSITTGATSAFGPLQEVVAAVALAVAAVGCIVLAGATRRATGGASSRFPIGVLDLALWLGVAAATTLVAWQGFVPLGASMLGIGIAVVAALIVVLRRSRFSLARPALRAPFVVLAHLALVEAALISWTDSAVTVPIGALAVASVVVIARTARRTARPAYVGVAYAYSLVLVATALHLAGLESIPVLCLTTTTAALAALAATLVRRIEPPEWYAILVVTAVPFLIGVAVVIWERSGWTALSTGVAFLLALTLVLTRRPGLNAVVRAAAAALLVPSLAVVVVCLGAEFLEVSGSPVTLPIIAGIVAVALPSTAAIGSMLVRRGLGEGPAVAVRLAIETSTLLTGAIAVLLALVREAAGFGTAIAVLVAIGIGAAATSMLAGRRYGWWLAGASWTGALWCVWAMLGVDVIEPYTLPPAIAGVVVAAVLVASGRRGVTLFACAIACGLLPSLIALTWVGNGVGDSAWRVVGLLAASVALLGSGAWLRPRPDGTRRRLDELRLPLLASALVAAAAGPIQAVRLGAGLDAAPGVVVVMVPALALSAAGAAIAVAAAALARLGARRIEPTNRAERAARDTRWLYAPALAYLVAGPVTAIRPEWFAIWVLWALMVALLAVGLTTVMVALRRRPALPPFWFVYGLAWLTGVAGWSMRDLRVEFFSLPLGLAVLAAGIIGMRPADREVRPTLDSWPVGFRGSWRLLAPGIVLTLLPSVLATGTDPQLYRPIMVIAFALVAILVGSMRKLAAPFILGIAVLPIENVVVFAAQLDRTVGAMPWWITLATAGAVLLTIAVGYERRSAQGLGVAARLRELE